MARKNPATMPPSRAACVRWRKCLRYASARHSEASAIRMKLKSNGDMSDRASLTSTKVAPQTATTPSSSKCARSFSDIPDRFSIDESRKSQGTQRDRYESEVPQNKRGLRRRFRRGFRQRQQQQQNPSQPD